MTSITNISRALRGELIIKQHQALMDNPHQVIIGEYEAAALITDVLHFCREEGILFPWVLELAEDNYKFELLGIDDYLEGGIE